jgi:hypothetical protein
MSSGSYSTYQFLLIPLVVNPVTVSLQANPVGSIDRRQPSCLEIYLQVRVARAAVPVRPLALSLHSDYFNSPEESYASCSLPSISSYGQTPNKYMQDMH